MTFKVGEGGAELNYISFNSHKGIVPMWRSRTSSGPESRRLAVHVKRLAVLGEG